VAEGTQSKGVMAEQVDGNHYKGLKIQPTEYALANKLDCLQFSVVKHMTRHPLKGEGVEDIKKTIHYARMALAQQYGIESSICYADDKS
jgi:hypothetical protein